VTTVDLFCSTIVANVLAYSDLMRRELVSDLLPHLSLFSLKLLMLRLARSTTHCYLE